MPLTRTASQVLDREYLEIRTRILDIAASLDRIGRGTDADAAAGDVRMRRLHDAMAVLVDGQADRARRVQMVFSDAFDAGWRDHP